MSSSSPTLDIRAAVRLPVALAVGVVLAFGASACGSDDDDKGGGSDEAGEQVGTSGGGGSGGSAAGGGSAPGGPYRPKPNTEEERAYTTVTGVYDALGDGKRLDTKSLCDLMSVPARRQTTEYARRSSGVAAKDWTCEKAVDLLADRSKRVRASKRALKATVIGMNVEGDRATATVRFGKGAATTLPLVREDGEWRLASTPDSAAQDR